VVVPDDLPHSVTVFACGPADGPAVQIFLAEQPISNGAPVAPYISIYIDRSITQLQPGTYAIGDKAVGITITRWSGASSYENATSGAVHITGVSADRTVTGDVTASFPSDAVTGAFVAPWQDRQMTCP